MKFILHVHSTQLLSSSYFQFAFVFTCCLHFSVSKERLMGPSMSVCLIYHHIVTKMTLDHVVPMTWNFIIARMTLGTIVAFVIPWLPCWSHWLWYGVKNTFGFLVYSKDYTFPVLLIVSHVVIMPFICRRNGRMTLSVLIRIKMGTYLLVGHKIWNVWEFSIWRLCVDSSLMESDSEGQFTFHLCQVIINYS
jgi:hypothetical protein